MNATIAFHFLCTIAIKALTLEEIFEKPTDLRLIGLGSGFLLPLLEKLFGKLKTFQKHAVLQDVFGNFYADFEEGPGYWYASATWLLGQIYGLVLCSKTDLLYEWWEKVSWNSTETVLEEGSRCYYAPPVLQSYSVRDHLLFINQIGNKIQTYLQ